MLVDVNDEAGEHVMNDILDKGHEATYIHADVSKASECEAMIAFAEKQYGKLNVLFNNAGIMHGSDDNAQATENPYGTLQWTSMPKEYFWDASLAFRH